MIAVIFELEPRPECEGTYFSLAADLKPVLETIEGFISVERFQSLSMPGRYLSLSFWEDEAAVQRWRTREAHRNAQRSGRDTVFAEYRLRVAHVVRDYGLTDRAQAPDDSREQHG